MCGKGIMYCQKFSSFEIFKDFEYDFFIKMMTIGLIKKCEKVIYTICIKYTLNWKNNDIIDLELKTNLHCSYKFEDSIELFNI